MANLFPTSKKSGFTIPTSKPAAVKQTTEQKNEGLRGILAGLGLADPTKAALSGLQRAIGVIQTPATGVRASLHNILDPTQPVDIIGEMGKSLKGEKTISGADILAEHGVSNPWAKTVGGIAVDILTDPLVWMSAGYSAATKAAASTSFDAIASAGFDPLAAAAASAEASADGVSSVTPKMLEAANSVLDAAKGGQYGEEVAAAASRGALNAGSAPAAFLHDLKMGLLQAAGADPAIGGGVDLGGIKFAGKTILPVQEQLDALAQGVKGVARALPGAKTLESMFSHTAPVAQESGPEAAQLAKGLLTEHAAGASAARGAAAEAADIARGVDETTRYWGALAFDQMLPTEARSEIAAAFDEAKSAMADAADGYNRVMRYTQRSAAPSLIEGTRADADAAYQLYEESLAKANQLVADNLDVGHVADFLTQHGVPDEQVKAFTDTVVPRLEEAFTKSRAAMNEQGLQVKALLGEPAGSKGFMPHYPEINPSEAKDAILTQRMQELGLDGTAADLKVPGTNRTMQVGAGGKRLAVGKNYARKLDTLDDWLREGIKPELDMSTTAGRRIYSDYIRANNQALWNDAAKMFGQPLTVNDGVRAALPEGMVSKSITANGFTTEYAMPKALADTLDNYTTKFSSDAGVKGFLKAFDSVQGLWKRTATTWNPGFYGKRPISDYALAYSAGLGSPSRWGEIPALMAGKAVAVGDESLSAADIFERMVSTGGLSDFTNAEEGAKSALSMLNPNTGSREAANQLYRLPRMAAWLAAKDKGLSDAAASKLVTDAMYSFDPALRASFERTILARVFPFERFMVQNTKHMAELFAKQPGTFSALFDVQHAAQAANPVDTNIQPEFLTNALAIPLPIKDKSGNTVMFSPYLPQTQVLRFLSGGPEQIASDITPAAKEPLQLATNFDWFYNTPIEQFPGEKVRAPGTIQAITDALDNTPLAPAWGNILKAVGAVPIHNKTTGETYIGWNAKLNHLVTNISPFLNNINKTINNGPLTPYSRVQFATGQRFDPFDTQKFAQNKALKDMHDLQNELARLKQLGYDTAKPKKPKKAKANPLLTIAKGKGKKGDAGFGLAPAAYTSLLAMNAALVAEGLPKLAVSSGARTVAEQKQLKKQGAPVAPPAQSKHVGTNVKVADLTTEGERDMDPRTLAWLHANAATFGWANPDPGEPWHWEYAGPSKGAGKKGDVKKGCGRVGDTLSDLLASQPYTPHETDPYAGVSYLPPSQDYSPFFSGNSVSTPSLNMQNVLAGMFQPIQTTQQKANADPVYNTMRDSGSSVPSYSAPGDSGGSTIGGDTPSYTTRNGLSTFTPKPSGNTGVDKMLTGAEKHRGLYYEYGGTSEKTGFDCSAYIQHVAKEAGFTLPRTAEEQRQWFVSNGYAPFAGKGGRLSQKVSEGDLRVGDVLTFKTSSGTERHTGFYVGQGMILDSPHTGAPVDFHPLKGRTIIGVGRLPIPQEQVVATAGSYVGQPVPQPFTPPDGISTARDDWEQKRNTFFEMFRRDNKSGLPPTWDQWEIWAKANNIPVYGPDAKTGAPSPVTPETPVQQPKTVSQALPYTPEQVAGFNPIQMATGNWRESILGNTMPRYPVTSGNLVDLLGQGLKTAAGLPALPAVGLNTVIDLLTGKTPTFGLPLQPSGSFLAQPMRQHNVSSEQAQRQYRDYRAGEREPAHSYIPTAQANPKRVKIGGKVTQHLL